ncbi:MAG: chromosomal replication initiator protein DnaA [Deltaproteobacteria bacterium]|jgi:chromosomal replication initiator protein|nr:chromosomal replication initiator protein DnaA [Deltaproteobacteria bacterium]
MSKIIVDGGDLSLEMGKLWPSAVAELSARVPEDLFKTWIARLRAKIELPNVIEVVAPNEFFLRYVQGHFKNEIEDALTSIARANGIGKIAIKFAWSPEPPNMGLYDGGSENGGLWLPPQLNPLAQMNAHARLTQNILQFNPNFTFDNFIVGDTNCFAYSAARAFSRNDDLGNNILCFLSDHGLGKSHLSQAMAQAILAQHPDLNLIYMTAEDFTNAMTRALHDYSMDDFKIRFRHKCDVLVLDNITFLGGKGKIQQEVGYTMDYLLDKGKRVVLTTTYHPGNIPRINQALKSRFCSSLVAPIQPPDFDTRVKILVSKAGKENITLNDRVLELIASNITSDVRLLEASVTSIAARCRLFQRTADLNMARECLSNIASGGEDGLTIKRILKFVCHTFKVDQQAITSNCRQKKVSEARSFGIYLCRLLTGKTLDDIGHAFGRRHSSVLYALNKLEQTMKKDPRVQNQVDLYIGQLNAEL